MTMAHLDVHFLNVGHGDCTFLVHPSGRITMIDVNNSRSLPLGDEIALAEHERMTLKAFRSASAKASGEQYYKSLLTDPAEYYKARFARSSIFRYIQTHPDLDHMSGLCRFFWQDDVPVENVWDVEHEKTFAKEEFEGCPYDWNDWLVYSRMRKGLVQDDDTHRVLHNLCGATGDYWTEDGIKVYGPTEDLVADCNQTEDWNNLSFVLAVEFGGRRLILPADAEKPAWDSVEAEISKKKLSCDILKASHHGRESGYSKSAVDVMDPSIVICSVGKKPDTDASDKYRSHGAEVFSTRYQGTIVARIWADGEVWVTNHKGEQIASLPVL